MAFNIRSLNSVFAFLFLVPTLIRGQTDSLNIQNITVVGSYNPTVNEAFKLKDIPVLNDTTDIRKMPVHFQFPSVPVASTFTPSKGKAAGLEKRAPDPIYNSYASWAFGNFLTNQGEFYTSRDYDRGSKRLDFALNHKSSLAQMRFSPLPTDYSRSSMDVTWSQRERDFNWYLEAGAEHRLQHWYGLPGEAWDTVQIDSLDVRQHYLSADLNGKIAFEDSYLQDASFLARIMNDATSSSETRIKADVNLKFPVLENFGQLGLFTDLVQGKFANAPLTDLINGGNSQYGLLLGGVRPGILLEKDRLLLDFGARITYAADLENQDGSFYIYPDIRTEFALKEQELKIVGGLQGNLLQNSFYDFSLLNPFVSPTLTVRPTDQKYNGFLGLRGQLGGVLGFQLLGQYGLKANAPFFVLNSLNTQRQDQKAYFLGNSFRVIYQNLKTLGLTGELQWLINRNFNLQITGSVYEFDTDENQVAYNLPNHEVNINLDYQMDSGWGLWVNLDLIGKRKDVATRLSGGFTPEFVAPVPATPLTLDSYINASFQVQYRINPKWNAFVRVNNLLNSNYQQWAQFPVQGLQAMAGVGYGFDW